MMYNVDMGDFTPRTFNVRESRSGPTFSKRCNFDQVLDCILNDIIQNPMAGADRLELSVSNLHQATGCCSARGIVDQRFG